VSGSQSPFWRYVLFQIPGWILALVAAWWLQTSRSIPTWLAIGLPICWFVKDMALYPFLRNAYANNDSLPIERLIGSRGRAIETLSPSGYIRIGTELWHAEADIEKVERDATVEVIGAKGMVLCIRTIRDANEPVTPSKSV
ncbi:uncharacterized protein METZ01_LOCUS422483, partial [marine metagenome]